MRSREQIEQELVEAKEKLETYRQERVDYNGDQGAEHRLFLTSMRQLIEAASSTVIKLEAELQDFPVQGLLP